MKGNKINLGGVNDDACEQYEERGCRDTRDKVFLLNVKETIDYFKKETYIVPQTVWIANVDRHATATDYINAKSNALNPFSGETWGSAKGSKKIKAGEELIGSVTWWLRNIGCNDETLNNAAFHSSQAATVDKGAIWTGGTPLYVMGVGVRPAILINE